MCFYTPNLYLVNHSSSLEPPYRTASSVPKMSLWQSYRNLAPQTRLLLGLGIMGWAGIGMLVSGQAEKAFNMVPTDKDKENLEEVLPKVRVVERGELRR